MRRRKAYYLAQKTLVCRAQNFDSYNRKLIGRLRIVQIVYNSAYGLVINGNAARKRIMGEVKKSRIVLAVCLLKQEKQVSEKCALLFWVG